MNTNTVDRQSSSTLTTYRERLEAEGFKWNHDYRQHFVRSGRHWVFLCRECGHLTQAHTGRGYAAHEFALCSSECLSARVGRITVIE